MSMLARLATTGGAAAAAIEYVGGRTQTTTGGTSNVTVSLTSLTGGIGTAPAAGDIVIVYFGTGSAADNNLVIGSGFTELTELYSNDTNDSNLVVAYKVMGSTPDTSFTIPGGTNDPNGAGAIAVQVWRNVQQITEFATATGTGSVLCDPPAITPVYTGSVIVSGGSGAHTAGAATFSSSNLTGFITAGANNTTDATIGLGYNVWTSGAFDPAAFTFSSSNSANYSWAAVTLVLAPTGSSIPASPTFVASASEQTTPRSTITIGKPSGTLEGDLMVAIMASANTSGSSWTGATGWTEVADQTSAAPGLRIAYKVAGTSEGSAYTFINSSNSFDLSGCILTYRNAAYDTVGSFGGSATAPSINTSASNVVLIASFAVTSGTSTLSTPSGMTARVTDNGSRGPSYVVADQVIPPAGATGARSSSGGSTGTLVSIKPA